MATHVVFCSACDHDVTLVPLSPEWPGHLVLDTEPHRDVACMDLGRLCTGSLCPFCAEAATGIELEEASSQLPN